MAIPSSNNLVNAGPPSAANTFEPVASLETRLARNLVAARAAVGWTQLQLATKADVSRATIAQLETGVCDPRMSTITNLAGAFRISTLLLLLGRHEVRVLSSQLAARLRGSTAEPLLEADLITLRRLVGTGMLKDRLTAARTGADAARAANLPEPAIIGAAIGAPIEPGIGTAVGALLALLTGPQTTLVNLADIPSAIDAAQRSRRTTP